jgi:excinuclease ABC subunit A
MRVRSAATACRSLSLGYLALTTQWARAEVAMAWVHVGFFDPKRVVAFPELSLGSGAIRGWDKRNAFTFSMLSSLATHYEFDIEATWDSLPEHLQKIILHGSGDIEIPFFYLNEKGRSTVKRHPFEGVIPNLERRWKETDSSAVREELGKYRAVQTCPACQGSRLRPEARHVRIGDERIAPPTSLGDSATARAWQERGLAIYEVEAQPLVAMLEMVSTVAAHRSARQEIAQRIVREIEARLSFLNNVGLNLPFAGSQRRHDLGGRSATYSTSQPNRLRAHRCDVCVG